MARILEALTHPEPKCRPAPAAATPHAQPSEGSSLSPARVLVVDDSPAFLELLCDIVRRSERLVLGGAATGAVALVASVSPEYTAKLQAGKIIQAIAPIQSRMRICTSAQISSAKCMVTWTLARCCAFWSLSGGSE